MSGGTISHCIQKTVLLLFKLSRSRHFRPWLSVKSTPHHVFWVVCVHAVAQHVTAILPATLFYIVGCEHNSSGPRPVWALVWLHHCKQVGINF